MIQRFGFTKVLIFFFAAIHLFAGIIEVPSGYIKNPIQTDHGIIATNEYESAIYIIYEGKISTLVEAPGCGRYMSVSPDGNKIGFKLIDSETGLQLPAFYHFATKEVVELSGPVNKAGQVTFDIDGTAYFTIGNKLIRKINSEITKFDLGVYSNWTPVSPDGKSVTFKDENDQLWIYNLNDDSRELLTDEMNGYYSSRWSPDGNHIAYQSVDAKIYVRDIQKNVSSIVDDGENPRWSPDSESLIYFKKEIDFSNMKLVSSELYEYNLTDRQLLKITDTEDIFEMNPSYTEDGKIIFDTYANKQIRELENSNEQKIIYQLLSLPDSGTQTTLKKKRNVEEVEELSDWIHIHQVFDTRDSAPWTNNPENGEHEGYNCCGATTCMEAIVSYGILPPDPIYTYGHISEYGKYISDRYEFNDYIFEGFTVSGNRPGYITGAHGYMWNNGGSPHSNTVSFLRLHGIDASLSDNITWGKVKTEIDAGYPYVLCSTSLTSGHIVLGIGQYNDAQSLYCNDPYGDKNAGNYGGIRNGKNAVYDWGDANTGHVSITPVVWGITARYDRTLPLVSCYPSDGQKDVSTSTKIIMDFNNPLDTTSISEEIILYDDLFNRIEVEYDYRLNYEGKLIIDPTNILSENSIYKIYIDYRTSSVNGLQYEKNNEIEFSTGKNIGIIGTSIDDFEDIIKFELSTNATIDSSTSAQITESAQYEGTSSLVLDYEFTIQSNAYCRMQYSPEIVLGDVSGKDIGIWVYGDYSKNHVELWLTKSDGNLVKVLQKVIDWTGWKFISVSLDEFAELGELSFNSFAVRSNSLSVLKGRLYFDYISVFDSRPMIEYSDPSEGQVEVRITEKINIQFSQEMDTASTNVAVKITPLIEANFQWEEGNKLLVISPLQGLTSNTDYSIRIDTTAKDISGNALIVPYEFSFRSERTELSLVDSYPSKNMTEVSTNVKIILAFDDYIDPNTLYRNILFVDDQNNEIDIVVDGSAYYKGCVMFEPANDLSLNETYHVIIKEGVKDTAGLNVIEEILISFKTISKDYVSGNVLDNFESVGNWTQPVESDYSIGVHSFDTELTTNSTQKISVSNSAELSYTFTGIKGNCNIETKNPLPISSSGNIGVWIKGDYSFNDLQFWFADQSDNIIKSESIKLNWTGWKIIYLSIEELSGQNIKALHSLNVLQTDEGDISNVLLFDDLQTDVVLPVEEENIIPNVFSLKQNYPNPFNPSTTIGYSIPEQSIVTIKVFDVLGRELATLIKEEQIAGDYKIEFDASELTSGVYFYRLRSGNFVETKKMLLLK